MNSVASDQRIASHTPIRSPLTLANELPLNDSDAQRIVENRQRISDVIHGKDKRQLVVIGPCSIHDPVAALEYAEKLNQLRIKYADTLEIVMRVYFEKPRTIVGWKGLINDPNMDGSFDIDKGLFEARKLLIKLAQMGLPAGCEFLDAATGQFYADTVSWGAIGARTTESQVHRELASGLSCPVGFKNGTNGDVDIAIDAIQAASHAHAFLSPDSAGQIALYKTIGNADAHLILRGGRTPNYESEHVQAAYARQRASGLQQRLVVDCSHANSAKDFRRQSVVLNSVSRQIAKDIDQIAGVMIESHLVEGNQKYIGPQELVYGQSITDACIGWLETEQLLATYANSVALALG